MKKLRAVRGDCRELRKPSGVYRYLKQASCNIAISIGCVEGQAARWSESTDESSCGQVSGYAPHLEAAINARLPGVAAMWMRSVYFRSINKPLRTTDQVGSLRSSIFLFQQSIKRRGALTAGRPAPTSPGCLQCS